MKPTVKDSSAVRILWIEDSEWEQRLILEAVRTERPRDSRRFFIRFLQDATVAGRILEKYARKMALPDLVVFDLDLPDSHGLDTLETMSRLSEMTGFPAVVFSGTSSPGQRQRAESLGVLAHFFKAPEYGAYCRSVGQILEIACVARKQRLQPVL